MKTKSRALLAIIPLACLLLASAPAQAAEEQTHIFDATLTLSGDCSTSTLDPVPDPGLCPMPPGVPGVDHPNQPLRYPKGNAVDLHGNRYIASYGPEIANPNQGRIDVFGPDGHFITEIVDHNGPSALAVDSKGNLYVYERIVGTNRLVRYTPTSYDWESGDIAYSESPVVIREGGTNNRIAINRLNDHLFYNAEGAIIEFGTAEEGNPVIAQFGEAHLGQLGRGTSETLAIDAVGNRIYADGIAAEDAPISIQIFSLSAPHTWLGEFGAFDTQGDYPLAVEESTGHLFVGEYGAKKRVYEFEPDGALVSKIEEPKIGQTGYPQIAVDNGPTSPTEGYLFIPSGEGSSSRDYAFAPIPPSTAPVVESVFASALTETEAVLKATINPEGKPTSYRFEYTSEASFQEKGFEGATFAGEGTVPASAEPVTVSAPITGLLPGAAYRIHVVAKSDGGEDEGEARFITHRPPDPSTGCTNSALRTGASAALPDCRAFELVSPADTNGLPPLDAGLGIIANFFFASPSSSAGGDSIPFMIIGGSLPGIGGNGSYSGNSYLAQRGPAGWSTVSAGPNGEEASSTVAGSFSPDHGYTFWTVNGTEGSLAVEKDAAYLHYPDGHSELVGQGAVGTQAVVTPMFISEDGQHVIFLATQQLEPNAPPDGTVVIYDRHVAGGTSVVSLLPEDQIPPAGTNAVWQGNSLDGRGIAFRLSGGSPIYLRVDNSQSFLAAPASATYEGIAEGGQRLFYLDNGDLYAFDAQSGSAVRFTDSAAVTGSGKGDVKVVNLSADGSSAYFVSPSVLTGEANPNGAVAQEGVQNLYLSRDGAISFVGQVTGGDVEESFAGGNSKRGLGTWAKNIPGYAYGLDPSRSTPHGDVFVFETRMNLTGYDSEGRPEIYRYVADGGPLTCLSCPPTLAKPVSGGQLQSVNTTPINDLQVPVSAYTLMQNVRDDGRRVFFESSEPLVAADTDGVQDVYEWEDDGVGSCLTPGGCVYLISSGRSSHPNYLFGVSPSGDDVFIYTSDLLLPEEDPDETPSIYNARVGGGFPPPAQPAGECLGEACQPAASPPPAVTPASAIFEGSGNLKKKTTCPKGKRLVKKGKKHICVRKRSRHHHPHSSHGKQAGHGRKAGR